MDKLGINHKFLNARFYGLAALFFAAIATAFVLFMNVVRAANSDESSKNHVITIYDKDQEKTVISSAKTVNEALKDAKISVSQYDSVEPAPDAKIESAIVIINIRRARPIVVTDGQRQIRVITAAQSGYDIVEVADVKIYPEDKTATQPIDDVLAAGGAGLEMKITRAKVVNLRFYGQDLIVRTQAKTVREFMAEKKIELGPEDGMNLEFNDKISDQMNLQIWRNGVQTVTTTEEIAFTTKITNDTTRKVGYREIQNKGQNGQKTVIYQVEMRDGVEISRTKISEVIDTEMVEQVEIVGIKSSLDGVPALTARRGAQTYLVGSILRKETYYDLPMKRVMANCGQGGFYTVRSDGVKVDRGGLVIIAASLSRYPRCSEVDTSVGRGKVYDTGGFAAGNPEQFDIATDWSNRNGE